MRKKQLPESPPAVAAARRRYSTALASGDIRGQVASLTQLAEESIKAGLSLAAPRLVQEAAELVLRPSSPFKPLERARKTAHLIRLWNRTRKLAKPGQTPADYWFPRT
jgi:aminoglycoside phosphotransferase (APT) family kinase protein